MNVTVERQQPQSLPIRRIHLGSNLYFAVHRHARSLALVLMDGATFPRTLAMLSDLDVRSLRDALTEILDGPDE